MDLSNTDFSENLNLYFWDMNLIIQNISKLISLTSEEEQLFLSKTETRQYKAKTIILNAGQVCKEGYFVNAGLLRSFNINDNIVEHVMSFACEGWWISDMYSLLSQKPGNLFIEVLENAEVVILSKEKSGTTVSRNSKTRTFFQNPDREFFGGQSRAING